MSLDRVNTALDLLGQASPSTAPVHFVAGAAPQLHVGWGEFRQSLGSSLRATFVSSGAPRKFLGGGFFKDCWIERRMPRRAVIAAALWHVVFLVMPFPQLPASARRPNPFADVGITWSGPINDLPLLDLPAEQPKPSPRGEPEKPLPRRGAEAFHPRQRIFTDPVHPNHPRQTLVNPRAPAMPPKILPSLPNIVELAAVPVPARPHLQISAQVLAKLRPVVRHIAKAKAIPAPDAPVIEPHPPAIALVPSITMPARPKLQLNAGAAPIVTQRTQKSEVGPAPEVGAAQPAPNGSATTFIALSAAPAPPAPVIQLPQGNLSARVSISPEGGKGGVPEGSMIAPTAPVGGKGGAPGSAGTGNESNGNSLGISITGGNPQPKIGISGLGGVPGRIRMPDAHELMARPEPSLRTDDIPERTGRPNFAALPRGARPEQIFESKQVYTLYVNMPNLSSATGSWILNFSELRTTPDTPRITPGNLNGPAPLKKVDPKYPPALIEERVQGEVVLYAVIRRDGSVDSIQLVHGVDEQLDANAMQALSQWKFRPATKAGIPVELEAIVHIPFHIPTNPF
jgi:TonB family protein